MLFIGVPVEALGRMEVMMGWGDGVLEEGGAEERWMLGVGRM